MDTDVSNGSSDSTTSATALLSRKGLFGKSGVLNQSLDSSIATHQDSRKLGSEKAHQNSDEQNTSAGESDTNEHPSDGNTSKEEELMPENEHPSTDGAADHPEKAETNHSPPPSLGLSELADSKEKDQSHTSAHSEDHDEDEHEHDKGDEEKEDDETLGEDQDSDKNKDDRQGAAEESSSGDDHPPQSNDSEAGVAKDNPSTPEPCHEEVAEPEVEEEVCVKKIISMDTDDVEDEPEKRVVSVTDEEEGPAENDMEGVEEAQSEVVEEKVEQGQDTTAENPDVEMSDQMEEDVIEAAQPISESEGAIAEDVTEESEKVDDERASEKVTSKDETPTHDTSNSEAKQAKEDKVKEAEEDEVKQTEEDDEEEVSTPKRRSSSRRSAAAVSTEQRVSTRAKATPASATRTSSRKRHEDEEKADDEEKPVVAAKTRKSIADAKKKVEGVEEPKTPRLRGRRVNIEESKDTPVTTPAKGKKSAKKDATEAEDESGNEEQKKSKQDDEEESSTTRTSPRRRSSKVEITPKPSATRRGRSKNESTSSATEKEASKESNANGETPRKLRKAVPATPQSSKKSAKTPKSEKKERGESHDPYDIDTEMERHPEPLKNIQMEVQSFGEVKYAKVGSGKYERTEKTAEQRVGNLAEMTPRTKQRRSLADLTPGRKKAGSAVSGSSTAPQPSRRSRKSSKRETDNEENTDEPMEEDESVNEKSTPKRKANSSKPATGSARKRRAPSETPVVSPKRQQLEIPQLAPAELLAVDYPQDEHAQYETGARVYAMFDGLFYPAIVVSRDGLGRYKVHYIEDDLVKDVPPAGVIPLRALDRDKECYYAESVDKDRLAVKVVKSPDHTSASAWFEAEFELEQLDDDGEPTGKKFKGTWTKLALSKDDWREYINRKSREATDVIADNIESTEDRQLRRSKAATPMQKPTPRQTPKSSAKKSRASPSSQSKTPARGGRQKKGSLAKPDEEDAVDEVTEDTAEAHNEQIFAGKLFILTSANRPNTDTGFKKKFMTDFISSHGGLVVDDMKEVDEHAEMERFLISDTHYRTHKYLAALVRAMPCVSHEWISKCLEEKKLVDYKPFLLPSGVSILDEREYPLPTQRGLLLRNKRVMVHSNVTPPSKKSMSFEQIWVPMVPHLGGEIVNEMPNEEGQLDILLTDHSATPSIVEKARKIGSIVVSSEWLIQGIIMDRLPDVNAHQKFLHNGGVCT
ncbi:hypothetical protein GCK32_001354 [Trichostrongylus colubriformis]|uniref:BRCT domain-containing protein n=1 Tax=Trichostrongylus colubriformis TaxID=6319 RepID=A0AAN8J320_TRICO